MKKITLFLMLLSISIYGQKKINKKDSISFNELKDLKGYKNRISVNNYQASSGEWFKIGDTLIIGKPKNLESSSTNNHKHIIIGSGLGVSFANGDMVGDKMTITKIDVVRFTKKIQYKGSFFFKKINNESFVGTLKRARAFIDEAIESGEIVSPNAPMTRSEAIKKLKEAKDLVNIEMMTKEEFNKLKEKLAPFIK